VKFEKKKHRQAGFRGHWDGVQIGINSFANIDYSGFTPNFMDLDYNNSNEVQVNFLEQNICLQKRKKNIGLVSGIGLTFNDYRFSNSSTIKNDNGMVKPAPLDEAGLSKSKLSTTYLTIPLLLECQVPIKGHAKQIYISGGVIGGLKINSHTKVKRNEIKEKNRNDFNINPFRYGATARIGLGEVNIFGAYYFSTFFKDARGPEMYPFTIGITFGDR